VHVFASAALSQQECDVVSAPMRYRMNFSASVALVCLVIATFVLGAMIESWITGDGPPAAFIALWLSITAIWWIYVLFVGVVEVRLWPDDGRLEFRSILRKRETHIADIVEIDCRWWVPGPTRAAVNIRYRGGGYRRPVARLGNEKASRDLVQRIQEWNPSLEVKGRPIDPWRSVS
jgi:hypothetical protein